jgi:hypothetical protein
MGKMRNACKIPIRSLNGMKLGIQSMDGRILKLVFKEQGVRKCTGFN